MKKNKILIDLLWYKPRRIAGIGSVARNLIRGFSKEEKINSNFEFYFLVTKDNYDDLKRFLFEKNEFQSFKVIKTNVDSKKVTRRNLWRILNLHKIIKDESIDIVFFPTYEGIMYKLFSRRAKTIVLIHDLQALHLPEYHSIYKRLWLHLNWFLVCKFSDKVLTISNFVKQDLIKRFNILSKKVVNVYNPIVIENTVDKYDYGDIDFVNELYIYTVSTMLPHKNLITLIRAFERYIELASDNNVLLVISGVSSEEQMSHLLNEIDNESIRLKVIFTGFISDYQRNFLYQNCDLFAFPSLFEGFGMPPIEAMEFGANVIASNIEPIKEITKGRAVYIEDPVSIHEWVIAIQENIGKEKKHIKIPEYELSSVVNRYLQVFKTIV